MLVHFFRTPAGDLRCRATDVHSRKSWIVASARELRAIVFEPPTTPSRKERSS